MTTSLLTVITSKHIILVITPKTTISMIIMIIIKTLTAKSSCYHSSINARCVGPKCCLANQICKLVAIQGLTLQANADTTQTERCPSLFACCTACLDMHQEAYEKHCQACVSLMRHLSCQPNFHAKWVPAMLFFSFFASTSGRKGPAFHKQQQQEVLYMLQTKSILVFLGLNAHSSKASATSAYAAAGKGGA